MGGPGDASLAAAQALGAFGGGVAFDDTVGAVASELSVSLFDPDPRVRQRSAVAIGRVNMAVAEAIPVLFSTLCSSDVRVKKRAAVILAGIDDYAANVVPALSERIANDGDPIVARASAQALGNLGIYGVGGLPALVGVLDHDDVGVRYYAGDSVGNIDDQMSAASDAIRKVALRCGDISHVAVQQLAARLQPDRTAFRQKATESLAGIGEAAQSDVDELSAQLGQGQPEERERVVHALSDRAQFSSAAVASLAREGSVPGDGWEVAVGGRSLTTAVGDEQHEVRYAATQGIREASREVTSASMALQEAPRYDPAVRRAANRALQSIDDYASLTVPALLDALKDEDIEVRRAAAQALGEMGPQAGMSAPALVDAVKSEPAEVRAEAAFALGRVKGEPATAVPTLADALHHPEPVVRYQAARGLGLLGSDAASAVPELQAALGQPDAAMRYQATRALMAIDPAAINGYGNEIGRMGEQDVALVLTALKSEDPQRRSYARQVLGNMGPAAIASLPGLAKELAVAPPATRQQLVMTMQEITASALTEVPELIEAMQAGGPGADLAAQALGEVGANANRAKRDLIEALDDPDPEVRLAVAEVLGDISDYTAQVIGALMIEAREEDDQALAALERHGAGG
jgi:HEAT repeat protein